MNDNLDGCILHSQPSRSVAGGVPIYTRHTLNAFKQQCNKCSMLAARGLDYPEKSVSKDFLQFLMAMEEKTWPLLPTKIYGTQ